MYRPFPFLRSENEAEMISLESTPKLRVRTSIFVTFLEARSQVESGEIAPASSQRGPDSVSPFPDPERAGARNRPEVGRPDAANRLAVPDRTATRRAPARSGPNESTAPLETLLPLEVAPAGSGPDPRWRSHRIEVISDEPWTMSLAPIQCWYLVVSVRFLTETSGKSRGTSGGW